MKITSFGNISDAISAGQRAEARMPVGPVQTAPVQFASLQFGSSDFTASSIIEAINRPKQFVWGVDKFGSKTYMVTD